MTACPSCGTRYEASVRICPRDGTVLEPKAGDSRIGETLDGKYRLDAAIGHGGMGAIYRATHLMLDKQVAVKLIKPELVTSPDVVRRFQREARAAGNLSHPNIAAAFDLGQTQDGTLYIAMELINGPSLKDVIRAGGPMSVDRTTRIMRQIGGALALAHRHGIIHRDLKPHNVMLATSGGSEVPKLLDFGIAKTFDDASTQLTATGFVLGTPQYMSPEQAAGREIDGRSDLYSLGIILYEMLIGEVPFNDPSTPAVLVKHLSEPPSPPSVRRPDLAVSPVLEAIALRCLAKDPADRFQTADEFVAALPESSTVPVVVPAINQGTTVLAAGPAAAATIGAAAPGAYAPTITPGAIAATGAASARSPMLPAKAVSAATVVAPLPMTAPTAPSRDQSLRNLLVMVALLMLLVGGVGYGAMQLFRRGESAPQASAQPPGGLPLASTSSDGTPPVASMPEPAEPSTVASGQAQPSRTTDAKEQAEDKPGPKPDRSGDSPLSDLQTDPLGDKPRAPKPPIAIPPAASAAAQTPAAAGPAPVTNPAVAFRCEGAPQVCAALRTAMTDALSRQSLRPVRDAGTADVVVDATVTVVDERPETLYGQSFITRTYSVEFGGDARDGDAVPMPAASSVSFDSAVGQRRLEEAARTMSTAAAERVRAFWRTRTGG